MQTIKSDDFTLGQVFNDFYVVPDFQREYVWKEKQVNQLLEDITEEFGNVGQTINPEYFIGSIVVCEAAQGVYALIDGQQRMTTAYLLLCAIRDHLKDVGSSASLDALRNLIASTDIDPQGKDVYRYRVSLQYDDSCGILEGIAEKGGQTVVDRMTESVKNLLAAYRAIREFLRSNFNTDEAAVRRFFAYLTKNVKLIRIRTASVAHALKVFETINDRGVGLNSMDLLKNLMFIRTPPDQFEKLKGRWKQLVDILFEADEKPLRFLRYFIFAHYDVDRLREEEIYEWFVKNEKRCGFGADPLGFVEKLLAAARAYANFIGGRDKNGARNRYLDNINYMSGAARQHLILLLASQHLDNELFQNLSRHLENLFFAYIITREPTKEFERTFTQWAEALRAARDAAALESFLQKYFYPAKRTLSRRFDLAMKDLTQNDLQQYRLRYVLAKLAQYVDEVAWGYEGNIGELSTYINAKVEIEHILAQNPGPGVRESFDRKGEYEAYVFRLGNLTLLEKTINASVGRGAFEVKRPGYGQSKFLLTQSLSKLPAVGVNTAVERAARFLKAFEVWTSEDILQRQMMLARLARKVWDMPETNEGNEGTSVGTEETRTEEK